MNRPLTLLTFVLCASSHSADVITNSIGMKLVRVEPGSFTMGPDGPAADYTQTRDGRIHLISSRNHYVFNLARLKELPPAPLP